MMGKKRALVPPEAVVTGDGSLAFCVTITVRVTVTVVGPSLEFTICVTITVRVTVTVVGVDVTQGAAFS